MLVCRRTPEGKGGHEGGGLSKGRSTFTEITARPATGAVVLSVSVRFDAGQMLKLHALVLRLARGAHARLLHACNLAYYGSSNRITSSRRCHTAQSFLLLCASDPQCNAVQGPAELQASQDMTAEPQRRLHLPPSASTRPDVGCTHPGSLTIVLLMCPAGLVASS